MKPPEYPKELMSFEPTCSYEKERARGEAMRKFHEDLERCRELSTRKGLEKVMALRGQGKKE